MSAIRKLIIVSLVWFLAGCTFSGISSNLAREFDMECSLKTTSTISAETKASSRQFGECAMLEGFLSSGSGIYPTVSGELTVGIVQNNTFNIYTTALAKFVQITYNIDVMYRGEEFSISQNDFYESNINYAMSESTGQSEIIKQILEQSSVQILRRMQSIDRILANSIKVNTEKASEENDIPEKTFNR